jgi:hypothetical protein
MLSESSIAFLKRLLDTPGPSGFESAPARIWRDEARAFADVSNESGSGIRKERSSRGLAVGDLDNDGDLDVEGHSISPASADRSPLCGRIHHGTQRRRRGGKAIQRRTKASG